MVKDGYYITPNGERYKLPSPNDCVSIGGKELVRLPNGKFRRNAYEIAFEHLKEQRTIILTGGRGTGKTYAALSMLSAWIGRGWGPDIKILVIRKSYQALRSLLKVAYPMFKGYARYKGSDGAQSHTFPGGELIEYRAISDLKQAEGIQGGSHTVLLVDELPLFGSPKVLDTLKAVLRGTNPEIPHAIIATGNPYADDEHGVQESSDGLAWFYERYIEGRRSGMPYRLSEQGTVTELAKTVWIHTTILDNPNMFRARPKYIEELIALNGYNYQRILAWAFGKFDRDVVGAFSDLFDRSRQVLPSMTGSELDRKFHVFPVLDWGKSDAFWCGWFGHLREGEYTIPAWKTETGNEITIKSPALVLLHEYVGYDQDRDRGLNLPPEIMADVLIEEQDKLRFSMACEVGGGYADFPGDEATELQRIFNSRGFNVRQIEKGPGSRAFGYNLMRSAFAGSFYGRSAGKAPAFYFTLPTDYARRTVLALRKEPGINDIQRPKPGFGVKKTDHAFDGIRYACMAIYRLSGILAVED